MDTSDHERSEDQGRSPLHDSSLDATSGRHETPSEKSDRQWTDILQELRVMQTGVQLIAGFLLTLPFQARFGELDPLGVNLYLGTMMLAGLTIVFMLIPVALHREFFGRHLKYQLVDSGHLILRLVLWLVGLLMASAICLVFYVVSGPQAALVIAAVTLGGLLVALLLYPWWRLKRAENSERALEDR
ncbi:hypothetical protein HD598_001046 [Neomicrococcus aestuarii]|uniref:Sodium:proton antiporter n=1 Tax=Neomicrococcus aestuarii TaxID=556325 RepID=A0A7W8X137_9MICC|nr:DUF6328 family protein [Neomicrococcus aestuarii]MBB5512359.1 hypothetical protein [Neomicrococcus aestuarii]